MKKALALLFLTSICYAWEPDYTVDDPKARINFDSLSIRAVDNYSTQTIAGSKTFTSTVTATALAGAFDHSSSGYIRIGNAQICWTSMAFTSNAVQAWTFPAAFSANPSCSCTFYWAGNNVYATLEGIGTTEAHFRCSGGALAINGYMIAIGAWQ